MKKVIMITGAGKGFGLEMAKAALQNGDEVIATVRTDPAKLYAKLGQSSQLLVVNMDVTNEEQIHSAVSKALQRFSKIDVLINNAGYGILTAVEEASDAEVRQQYATNVFGVLNVIRAVLPAMRRLRSGHIINITSLFGHDSVPGWTIYGSTKFAMEGISKGLAKELSPLGIYVTALAPGLFSTDFLNKSSYQAGATIIDDYETSVGPVRPVEERDGKQPGDPAKLADVTIRIAHEDQPPLHLLVGTDAIQFYKNNAAKTKNEVDKWLDLSLSTDHDPKS